ncbi:MAG: hypothetical protein HFI38_08985 [Lachnospiraceae bacterium]|nr:hypothetical protein [Lachnospiraceae bacterium]
MDERKYLTREIERCRRRMNLAEVLEQGILFAAVGGILGVICETVSLLLPFYHVHLAAGLCFGAGLATGVIRGICRRADRRQAARKLDSFGLKERMITAWEQLDMEGELVRRQRRDAVRFYEQAQDQIRIPLLPRRRYLLALLTAAAATAGLGFIPSPAREQAVLLHEVREEAGEEKEKLEELLEALEKVDGESLTDEQKERLREVAEALEISKEELARADSRESLASALRRLDYKYGQTAWSLESLAAELTDPESAGVAGAEALAKAAANENRRQTAGTGTGSPGAKGDDGSDSKEGPGSETGDGNGSGDGSGEGSGDGSGDGNGDGNGDGSGDGSGDGNGDGSGEGSGDGSGNGSGNGSGDGGPGRGTGSGANSHDYVSIPGRLGDDAGLTGDKTGSADSDYYREQNGLAWEGEHVDYGTVIGEYTDSAYEGIASGRYPGGMESVIRDYFESLNQ